MRNATEEHQVFDTELFKAGLLICKYRLVKFVCCHCHKQFLKGWDMAWPEAFRALLRQRVEVIIVPAYWTVDEVISDHDPMYVVRLHW